MGAFVANIHYRCVLLHLFVFQRGFQSYGFLPCIIDQFTNRKCIISYLLGSTLLRRSQRVASKACLVPRHEAADLSIALGLMRCNLLTGLARTSSSGATIVAESHARDLVPYFRHISFLPFFFPLPSVLTSCLRSHARGTLCMGSDVGSRKAVSDASQVC